MVQHIYSINFLPLMCRTIREDQANMLELIVGDADSFAQRAEVFYKKRPLLGEMIGEFYRAHRALAEQYDCDDRTR